MHKNKTAYMKFFLLTTVILYNIFINYASAELVNISKKEYLESCKKIISDEISKNQLPLRIVEECKAAISQLPKSFNANCERQDNLNQKAYFIWDADSKTLKISGNAISEDSGWLSVKNTNYSDIELYTSYEIIDASEILKRPELIRWRMSFWIGNPEKSGRTVRTFEFQINPSLKGVAIDLSFYQDNKVIEPTGGYVYLSNCQFSAMPY